MFEFDPRKSAANIAKHGIDFVEAQALWSDPDRIELPARPTNEPRFLVVGQIKDAVWTATVTYRHEEAIRIISVRRARDNEEAHYLDLSKARRPGRQIQRVNVDFPLDLLHAIDREAQRIGVNRQAFIKLRLADALTTKAS